MACMQYNDENKCSVVYLIGNMF